MTCVLIVDDNRVDQLLIERTVRETNADAVCLFASDPFEAREVIAEHHPDLILLDLHLPKMAGDRFLKYLKRSLTTPVHLVSSSVPTAEADIELLRQAGAESVIAKPTSLSDAPRFAKQIANALASESVVTDVGRPDNEAPSPARSVAETASTQQGNVRGVIAIGASTGGPETLQQILPGLRTDMPPIVIAQHLSQRFVGPLIKTLHRCSPVPVQRALPGTSLCQGQIYIAEADSHTLVRRDLTFEQVPKQPDDRFSPSVDKLFTSLAEIPSLSVFAVLLTGMGDDGAQGLKRLREFGAVTAAQDEASSVVFGMPRRAVEIGATDQVLSSGEVASWLIGRSWQVGRIHQSQTPLEAV
ncbi:MAG: chemotaxis protein CheB [Planctomycetota bacterium]